MTAEALSPPQPFFPEWLHFTASWLRTRYRRSARDPRMRLDARSTAKADWGTKNGHCGMWTKAGAEYRQGRVGDRHRRGTQARADHPPYGDNAGGISIRSFYGTPSRSVVINGVSNRYSVTFRELGTKRTGNRMGKSFERVGSRSNRTAPSRTTKPPFSQPPTTPAPADTRLRYWSGLEGNNHHRRDGKTSAYVARRIDPESQARRRPRPLDLALARRHSHDT